MIRKTVAFDLTITFSEPVRDFQQSELHIVFEDDSSASSTITSFNPKNATEDYNTEYTVSISPPAGTEDMLSVSVPADVAQDAATNNNSVSDTKTVMIDRIRPTVVITDVPDLEKNVAFDVTITFSEAVNGFQASEITRTGPATVSLTSGSDGDSEYTAEITPNTASEGNLTFSVPANVAQDLASNENEVSASHNVHIDTIVPTVEITDVPDIEKNVAFDVTITFSEAVKGFQASDLGDLVYATARLKSGSDGDDTYEVTITPNPGEEGDVTIEVPANVVMDDALNDNTASQVHTVHIDTIVPTVEITDVPDLEKNVAFDVTITFSEPVNGFAVDDIALTGPATVALKSGSDGDNEYTATITPNDDVEGGVTVQIGANTVKDAAGNDNSSASNKPEVHIDTIPPQVESITGVPEIEKNVAFDLTITFSEAVKGFTAIDLTVDGEATAILKSGSDGDDVYEVTIIPNTGKEGDVTFQVPVNVVTDAALNDNTASAVTNSVHIDTIVPTITISPPPTIEQNAPFPLTITISEEVNGFQADDLTVTGPATASLSSGSDGASVYTVTITPNVPDEGNVTVQVNANAVQDFALNTNTASTVTNSVHVDTIPPTVVEIVDVPTIEKNVPFDLTIRFSEAVNGFAVPADLTVTGEATASLKSGSDGNDVYEVTITPNAGREGDVTVQVNAAAVKDLALNDNTASTVTAPVHIDTIVPTILSITGVPGIEKNVPFDLTVTFSEDVTGFAASDLTVTGPATATSVSGSGAVYMVTITPNAGREGDVTVQVNADAVQDLALNDNTVSDETAPVHIDTIVPTILSITGVPGIEKNVPFDLTVTFSEDVTGFAASDLTVTGPATATSVSGSGAVYMVTITPNASAEGDVTVQVNADAVQDLALNDNTVSDETAPVHIDTKVPTVEITRVPDIEKNVAFDLTIKFSEAVNGFAVPADLTVTGPATATSVSGSGAVYMVTITPNAGREGDVTVQVNADAVKDLALNDNTVSDETAPVHIDTIVPTILSITGVPGIEKNVPFDLTVTFSEDVTGFAASDLTVTGPATATSVSGSGAVYMVTITPNASAEGDVTVQVNADAVQDLALNNNTASAVTNSVHIDTIRPEVESITGVPSIEKNVAFDLTIKFSEAVNDFQAIDLGNLVYATASLKSESADASEYVVTITPNTDAEGDVTIQVPAGAVNDNALNDNTASEAYTVHIDTIVPRVLSITDVPTIEKNVPFDLTIRFSEAVNGFAVPADLKITGEATASLKSGSDGNDVYEVTITPNAGREGDVTVQVNAAAVKDLALNDNTVSDETAPVHIDTIVPTILSITGVPSIEKNAAFDVTIKFSEAVNDFQAIDLGTLVYATASLKSGSPGASEYVVTITPNPRAEGDVTIQVPAGVAKDNALNNNTPSQAHTVHIDTIVPTVEITGVPNIEKNVAFDLTIRFLEAVNGFAVSDLTVDGEATAILASGSNGASEYVVTITPNDEAEGDVTIQVPAGAVTDAALNENTASNQAEIHIDTILPTVEIINVPQDVQLEAFSVTIVFSEDMREFVIADITLSGDAVVETSELTGSGSEYTLTITPHEDTDGDVMIQVDANVAEDEATNPNTASLQETVTVAPLWIPDPNLRVAVRQSLGLADGEDFSRQTMLDLALLDADGLQINDLTGLEYATDLSTAELNENEIIDISRLKDLTQLTTLDLSGNRISNISSLENLTQLITLTLENNDIGTILPLAGLTGITVLNLRDNNITDISSLADFAGLTHLDLTNNQIRDVSPILGLKNLEVLRISGNPILDLGATRRTCSCR